MQLMLDAYANAPITIVPTEFETFVQTTVKQTIEQNEPLISGTQRKPFVSGAHLKDNKERRGTRTGEAGRGAVLYSGHTCT
jgi:hypothetical protein